MILNSSRDQAQNHIPTKNSKMQDNQSELKLNDKQELRQFRGRGCAFEFVEIWSVFCLYLQSGLEIFN